MVWLLLLIPATSVAGFGLFGWWLRSQSRECCYSEDQLDNYQDDYWTHGEL